MLHGPDSLQVWSSTQHHSCAQARPSRGQTAHSHWQIHTDRVWGPCSGDICVVTFTWAGCFQKKGRKKIQIPQTLEDFIPRICKEHRVPPSGDRPWILLLQPFLYIFLLCNQPNYLFIRTPRLPTWTLLNRPQTNYQSPVFCHLSNLTDTVKKSKLLTAEQVSLKNRMKNWTAIFNKNRKRGRGGGRTNSFWKLLLLWPRSWATEATDVLFRGQRWTVCHPGASTWLK